MPGSQLVVGLCYDALSRRTQLTRPNGLITNFTDDGLSHLLSVLHQTSSTTLDGASYGYDYAGNRTSNTNHLSGITSNYGYDAIYELLNVTQGGSTTESYSYDAVGNRLSSSGVQAIVTTLRTNWYQRRMAVIPTMRTATRSRMQAAKATPGTLRIAWCRQSCPALER